MPLGCVSGFLLSAVCANNHAVIRLISNAELIRFKTTFNPSRLSQQSPIVLEKRHDFKILIQVFLTHFAEFCCYFFSKCDLPFPFYFGGATKTL